MKWFIADSMDALSPTKYYFISRQIYTPTDVFIENLRPTAYRLYRFREFRLPNEGDFFYKSGGPGFRKGEPWKRFIIDCNDTERKLLQLMVGDFTYFTYITVGSDRSISIKGAVDNFFGVEVE